MDNQLTYGIIKYCAEYVDIKKNQTKTTSLLVISQTTGFRSALD